MIDMLIIVTRRNPFITPRKLSELYGKTLFFSKYIYLLKKDGSKLKLLRSTTSADVTSIVVNTYNSQHMQDDKQFA
jgi:hypothetical protein